MNGFCRVHSTYGLLAAAALLVLGSCTTHINNVNPIGPGASTGTVTITNNCTTYSIYYFHYRSSGTSSWSSDLLSGTISAGGYDETVTVPAGTLDLLAINSQGDSSIVYGRMISTGSTFDWILTDASFTSGTGTLTIVNNSTISSIYYFYYRPNGSTTWSTNQLPGTISVGGDSEAFTVPSGTIDFKATNYDGDTAVILAQTVAIGGSYTWTITNASFTTGTPAAANILSIADSSSQDIDYVYIRVNGTLPWGTDRMWGRGVINVNTTDTFLLADGYYDILLTNSGETDSVTYLNWHITTDSLLVLKTWVSGSGGTIVVQNNTGYAVDAVYVSLSANATWGPDQLVPSSLANGSSASFPGLTPDSYDVKVRIADYYNCTIENTYNTVTAGQTTTISFSSSEVILPTGNLKITNNSTDTVWYAYVRLPGEAWSSDELTDGSTGWAIPPSKSYLNYNQYSGFYELVAFNKTKTQYQYLVSLSLAYYTTSTTTLTSSAWNNSASYTINNNSSKTISDVYIYPSTAVNGAGSNWLLTDITAYQTGTVINGLIPGIYNVEFNATDYTIATATLVVSSNGQTLTVSLSDSDFQ